MDPFLDQFKTLRRQRRPAALASVFDIEQGSSKRVGSRMWITEDGDMLGSLTVGGCVDGRARDEALQTLEDYRIRRFEIDLGEDGLDFGMSCAGRVDVHVARIDLSNDDDPAVRALEQVSREVAAGRRAVFAMPLGGASYAQPTARDEHELLESEEAACVFDRAEDVLYQSFVPPRRLVVVGAAPIADPLVRLGKMLGFHVTIVDGKVERLASRYADADEHLFGMPSEIVRQLEVDARTVVVLTAHDYRYEVPVLREVLERETAYVGFVASKRRGSAVLDFLKQSGAAGVDRVHVPVGLDIGAATPAEIAVSIMAEIVAERERATCLPLTELRRRTEHSIETASHEEPTEEGATYDETSREEPSHEEASRVWVPREASAESLGP